MKQTSILSAVLIGVLAAFCGSAALAGQPQRCPHCGGYHTGTHGSGNYSGGSYPGGYNAGAPGLPQGRRYYNGRYFGNLNNRFYGPQYGYF